MLFQQIILRNVSEGSQSMLCMCVCNYAMVMYASMHIGNFPIVLSTTTHDIGYYTTGSDTE